MQLKYINVVLMFSYKQYYKLFKTLKENLKINTN